ncbi:hypothetical protein ACIRBX_12940 [Kitasatospora sp. NPDC096147]|uniref:hypothetical protein n=1 Tax=Kitasatospora sp. NPDC096147 TaxID=3364093 RepID=UPI00380A613E
MNPRQQRDRALREAALAEVAAVAARKVRVKEQLTTLDTELRLAARTAYAAGAFWYEIGEQAGVSTETARFFRYDQVDGALREPAVPMPPRVFRERGE